MVPTESVELVEPALRDKPVSEVDVFVSVTVLPDNADLMHVELTAVNAFQAKLATMESVPEPAPHNAPDLSMVPPRPVVGIDVEETVDLAHLDSVARMESVCAILNVLTEIVDLMVVVDHAELVLPLLFVTVTLLPICMELATHHATFVEMESAHPLRPPPLFVLLNSIKHIAPKIAVRSLVSFLLLSDKRIN